MTPDNNQGVLTPLDQFSDFPARLAEAILEGIAKKPDEFLVLGLGFFVGYEGYDVMAHFMSGLSILNTPQSPEDILARAAMGLPGLLMPQSLVDVSKVVVFPWLGPIEKLKEIGDPAAALQKYISGYTASSGSMMGAVAKNIAGQANTQGITTDEDKTDMEKLLAAWGHDVKARLLLGALGALTAYMVTRPGFFSGIGEIVKGVGEIVPG